MVFLVHVCSAMVFLVHVCADLFRVLAHASAWEDMPVSSMFRNKEGSINGSTMVFLVHICANLFSVLAHTCAWEVRPESSMFRNKLRGISPLVCFGFPSTCIC